MGAHLWPTTGGASMGGRTRLLGGVPWEGVMREGRGRRGCQIACLGRRRAASARSNGHSLGSAFLSPRGVGAKGRSAVRQAHVDGIFL